VNVDTGEFRALAEQVADLREEVRHLREQALTLRTVEELAQMREDMRAGRLKFLPRARPAYLRPVDGGGGR